MLTRQVLLVVAIVLFVLGAVAWRGAPDWPWGGRLMNAGLAFFAASFLPGITN